MGFDAMSENYQRLGLHYARALGAEDPVSCLSQASSFKRRFNHNYDSLPQTDEDRAFHLMARATELIDHQLPFVEDETGVELINEARNLIDEAINLDHSCFDAIRIRAAQDCQTLESYYRFLDLNAPVVLSACTKALAKACENGLDNASALECELAMRPYLRWMATLASRALVSGRYRKTIEIARAMRGMDPTNDAGTLQTAYYAYAKLEDAYGLQEFVQGAGEVIACRKTPDPWLLIAQMTIFFRMGNREKATDVLHRLIELCPHAGAILMLQQEIPDGVFSRHEVEEGSNEEFALAVSEAGLLFQEGRVNAAHGSLGEFVAHDPAVIRAYENDTTFNGFTTTRDADVPASGGK